MKKEVKQYGQRNNVLTREQSLALLKRERRKFYNNIKTVACPILEGAEVHFTAQGFDHLINESNSSQGNSKPRTASEQYLKLMHLEHAPYIIRECTGVAEKRRVSKKVKRKWINGYNYELTCNIEDLGKVSVLVEKLGNGNYKFLSVFPLYKRNKNKKRPKGRS